MFLQIFFSVFKTKGPMRSTPASDAADVEAGRGLVQEDPREPARSRPWFTRVSVIYLTFNSTPLAVFHKTMNIAFGMVVALVALASLYIYAEGLAESWCPTHADLDLQMACMPETLLYRDAVFHGHAQRTTSQGQGQRQCLDHPAQTLPHPRPCNPRIFHGKKNITCFVQKVIYQKWMIFELGTTVYSPTPVINSQFVSETLRSYYYSCRAPVNDELPRTSYKERLELVERIRTIIIDTPNPAKPHELASLD